MSLHSHAIVLPFRIDPNPQGAIHTLHVEAVSSSPEAGIRLAKAFAPAIAHLRYQSQVHEIYQDRISADKPRVAVPGPYAYVIGRSNRIPHLMFAPRMDDTAANEFAKSLQGIDPASTYGVLLDCAALGYINSRGLSTLAEYTPRLNLHIFRMPPKIMQIMAMAGLDKVCRLHASLKDALNHMVAASRTQR